MNVTRIGDTAQGPAAWFTGAVFIDTAAVPAKGARISASNVHFTPGARTAWHRHPHGQSLFVLEGFGYVQRRGGPIEVIRAGDRVFIEPGEEHWHGASATRFMTHIAMLEVGDDGSPATWGDHVTDDEYGAAPPITE
jgi:quercetin dioxygenase-like cupin family protein